MNLSSFIARLTASAALLAVACISAPAATLLDTGMTSLTGTDPTQIGRLFRTGVASNWSSAKPFPGVTNPGLAFSYRAFVVPASPFGFIQVSVDDPSAFLFAAAYSNSYAPNPAPPNFGLSQNYLGDQGGSGNQFGNPGYFQVAVPSPETNQVVIVVTDASGGAGIGTSFNLLVEGFYDPTFNDTVPTVPEPSSLALAGAGLLGLVYLLRKAWERERLSVSSSPATRPAWR